MAAAVARGGAFLGWLLIGIGTGMARLKITKDRENTPLHGLGRFVPFWLWVAVGGGSVGGGGAGRT
jgi:hypothetical protein